MPARGPDVHPVSVGAVDAEDLDRLVAGGAEPVGQAVSNSATSPGRIVMSCSPRMIRSSPASTESHA